MGDIIKMPTKQQAKSTAPKKRKTPNKPSAIVYTLLMTLLFSIIIATGTSTLGESISIQKVLFIGFWLFIFSFAVTAITKQKN